MYQPTPEDIAWAESLIASINEGGCWLFPNAGQVYTISHIHKTVEFVNGERNDECDPKTIATFAAVGYQVIYPELVVIPRAS